jgi:hypothetical protein
MNGSGRILTIAAIWSNLSKTVRLLTDEWSAKVLIWRILQPGACGTQILRNDCIHVYCSSVDLACSVFNVCGSERVIVDPI